MIRPPYTLPEQRMSNKHAQGLLFGKENVVTAGGYLRSGDYVAGVSGWQIDGDGDVEFNDGTFRGSIEGGAIDIGGADASSFHVDADGNMWLGAATFAAAPFKVSNAGALTATDGTLTGTLTVTGTISGGTVSGARFETAASGARVVVDEFGTDDHHIVLFTGSASEMLGATIVASVGGTGSDEYQRLTIVPGDFRGDGATTSFRPAMLMHSGSEAGTTYTDGKVSFSSEMLTSMDEFEVIADTIDLQTPTLVLPDIPTGTGTQLSWTGAANVVRETSSRRYKEQITDLAECLDPSEVVAKLRPVVFVYKQQPEAGPRVGLIAEEVQEFLPELVNLIGGEPESLNYGALAVLAVAAIQDLTERVAILEPPKGPRK